MTKRQYVHFLVLLLLLTALIFIASCSGIDDPLADEESDTEDKAIAPVSSEELTDEEAVDPQELADDLSQVDW